MRLSLNTATRLGRVACIMMLTGAAMILPGHGRNEAGGAAHAGTPTALQFQPGTARLAPGLPENTLALTRIGQLLQRHGATSTLELLLEGRADCPGTASCELLRRRVETVLGALAADWPAADGPFPTGRLRWQARASGRAALPDDGLRLLLAPGAPPDFAACGAVIWLRDPALPPGTDGAAGRIRLLPGGHPRPEPPARLVLAAGPDQAALVLRTAAGGAETRIHLPPGGEVGLDLTDGAAGGISLILQPAGPEIASGRTIADQLRPWSGEIPSQSAADQPCHFQFAP